MASVQSRIGLTPKQAERLKHKLDKESAKIEDALAAMRRIVPDTDPDKYTRCGGLIGIMEEVHGVKYGLSEVIDRRTRNPRH